MTRRSPMVTKAVRRFKWPLVTMENTLLTAVRKLDHSHCVSGADDVVCKSRGAA